MNVEPLFSHLKSFSQFDALFKTYQKLYSQVANANQGQIVFPLKTMNLYSTYKVPLNEIKDLYRLLDMYRTGAIVPKQTFLD